MFARFLGAARADIDRQIGWAKGEIRRQTRHTALVAVLSGLAALAALGAATVGLIAAYGWLATGYGPFIALGIIGGGLLLVSLILALLAFVPRRPALASRPPLEFVRPLTVIASAGKDHHLTSRDRTLKLAADTLPDGSRSAMFSALALATVVGLMAGRRLRRPNAP